MSKPTILFVTGAWLPVEAYATFTKAAESEGYRVIATSYPSKNATGDPESMTVAMDTAYIRKDILEPLVEQEEADVIIVTHSYGTVPGLGAATGLSRLERQRDHKNGGVMGLIVISGYVAEEGQTLVEVAGGAVKPWVTIDDPLPGLCLVRDPQQVFAADIPKSENDVMMKVVQPMALVAFSSALPAPAHLQETYRGVLAYIKCLKDAAITIKEQEAMIQNSTAVWMTKEMDVSHNGPFASANVKETMGYINEFVDQFGMHY